MALPLMPLGATQIAQQTAPGATAPAETNFMDMFANTPLGLALLQGGLSMLSGAPAGQAFSQGLGLYNQYAAAEAAKKQQGIEQQFRTAELGLKERDTAATERTAKAKETEAQASLLKAQKAGKEAQAPKGVNIKLWEAAKEAEEAATPLGEEIDISNVNRRYNNWAGENDLPAYEALDNATAQALIAAVEANPELADQYFGTASEIYGPRGALRLKGLYERKQKTLTKEAETKAKETEEAVDELPESLKPKNIARNVQQIRQIQSAAPTVNPQDIYKVMYQAAPAGNPWAGMTPEVMRAMTGQ